MKKLSLFLILFSSFIVSVNAQCNTYVQMVSGVESCLFPVVVSTQQVLLPCSAPANFFQLTAGDYALIDYTVTNCTNTCMAGTNVDISCCNQVVGIENPDEISSIKVSPTLVQSQIHIKGNNITRIEIYNACGTKITEQNNPTESIDISALSKGVYFIRVFTENHIITKKAVKI